MRNFQHKKGWGNIIHSKPVLILLFVLIVIFIWNIIGFMGKMEVTKENRELAEAKVLQLEKQKESLSKEIAKLNTEDGREESIRERFPVVKEGENVIVIVEDKNTKEVENKDTGGFFSFLFFWKNWFE